MQSDALNTADDARQKMPELTWENLAEYADKPTILIAAATELSNEQAITHHAYQDDGRLGLLLELRAIQHAETVCRTLALTYTHDDGTKTKLALERDTASTLAIDRDAGSTLDCLGPVTVFDAVAKMLREIAALHAGYPPDIGWLYRSNQHVSKSLEYCASLIETVEFDAKDDHGKAMRKLRFLPNDDA